MGAEFSGKDSKLLLPAWTFKSGSKIAFSHIQHEQDKYNHQGKEWHFEGFDQLEEFTETQYLFVMAQNRSSDPSIKCLIRSSANPGGIGHGWYKKRFIDSLPPNEIKFFKRENDEDIECKKDDPDGISRCFIPASLWDNPSLYKNDPNYVRRLQQLPEEDKQALLYGNWDVFKGQFFKMWRKGIHVAEREVLPTYRKFLSLDYGYAAPSSVGWWMVDYDGRLHRYRELYKEQLTYEKLAYLVREKTPSDEVIDYCVADPAIWGDRTHHKDDVKGESGAETMQRIWNGFTGIIKGDNSRITGWGRMRTLLTPYEGANGKMTANMTCSPYCKDSIRTIPNLIHDEFKVEDVDTDGEDHAGDDWRLAAMSRPSTPEVPKIYPQDGSMTEEIYLHYAEQVKNRSGYYEDRE